MNRGFTLLELLVGVALMALLAALLFASLRFGAGSLARVDATAAVAEERRIVAAFLRQRLAGAEPLVERDATGAHVAFDGTADRLRLVADMPPAVGGGRHRLSLENTARGLQIAWTPLLGPDAEPVESGRRRLAAGAARFAYYGRRAGAAEAAWHQTWTGELALPRLVRLQLAGEPPLIVALTREAASR
jgi:prepilin-type N-terminal cleavage/methylation domain-containing protein